MAHDGDRVEIVHAGAAEGAVGDGKPGRLDNVRFDPQAGAQPQNRAGILRNIGLIKGDSNGHFRTPSRVSGDS